MFKQIGNFEGEHAGLARSRAGDHQQRLVASANGLPLAGVELGLPEAVGAYHRGVGRRGRGFSHEICVAESRVGVCVRKIVGGDRVPGVVRCCPRVALCGWRCRLMRSAQLGGWLRGRRQDRCCP